MSGVDIPMLILVGEKYEFTLYNYHASLIIDDVAEKSKIQVRIVTNVGYFSSLSPLPESMTNEAFAPSQDQAGFDRETFLDELNAEVLDFLIGIEVQ